MRFPSSNTLHKSFQPRTKWVVKATTTHLEINNNKNRLYPIWPSASLWFQYRCINTHTHTPRFSKSWTLDCLWNPKDCLTSINFKPSRAYSSQSLSPSLLQLQIFTYIMVLVYTPLALIVALCTTVLVHGAPVG